MTEPAFIEHHNAAGPAPVLLLADHAGRAMPPGMGSLGVDARALERHIAYDIGVADLTRRLSRALGASAILNHASRLLIDPNRRPGHLTSIPALADGTPVPGNRDLAPARARERLRRFWLPYQRAVARRLAAFRREGIVPAVIAIHSYTPRLDGIDRPWQLGVLWRDDDRLAAPLLAFLRARPNLVTGDNEPYSGLIDFGFTVEFHCQRARLPHVMVEVRQDEIATRAAAEACADLLAAGLRPALADPTLHRPWHEGRDRIPWHRYRHRGRA